MGLDGRSDSFEVGIIEAERPRGLLCGEFDPGSGRTLAACFTHVSRTGGGDTPSGRRLSNTWATCPLAGDSRSKERVIPRTQVGRKALSGKQGNLRDWRDSRPIR